MLIIYIATGAFLVGGGLVFLSNLVSESSKTRYY